jgi:hypothetical protein
MGSAQARHVVARLDPYALLNAPLDREEARIIAPLAVAMPPLHDDIDFIR